MPVALVVKTALNTAPEANESLFLSLMRTLEDAVEEASADVGVDEEVDDPAPVLPAPLAPRLGLSADSSNTGDFETYNRAVKNPRT